MWACHKRAALTGIKESAVPPPALHHAPSASRASHHLIRQAKLGSQREASTLCLRNCTVWTPSYALFVQHCVPPNIDSDTSVEFLLQVLLRHSLRFAWLSSSYTDSGRALVTTH